MVKAHDSISNDLKTIMSKVFEVDSTDITDDASPETIDTWDSLNHVSLVAALESNFHIRLTMEEILEMEDMASIRAVLQRHGL